MKIPLGMTEKQVVDTIQIVSNRLANKFKFSFFTIEDIKQEIACFCIQALEDYDPKRPLENFLMVHARNRLINFKRDNLGRINFNCKKCPKHDYKTNTYKFCNKKHKQQYENSQNRINTKKNIIEPINIGMVKDYNEPNMSVHDNILDNIANKEIVDYIEENMILELRGDYLRIKAGVSIPRNRRSKVLNYISKLLENTDV